MTIPRPAAILYEQWAGFLARGFPENLAIYKQMQQVT